jgi:hypothetical protein
MCAARCTLSIVLSSRESRGRLFRPSGALRAVAGECSSSALRLRPPGAELDLCGESDSSCARRVLPLGQSLGANDVEHPAPNDSIRGSGLCPRARICADPTLGSSSGRRNVHYLTKDFDSQCFTDERNCDDSHRVGGGPSAIGKSPVAATDSAITATLR